MQVITMIPESASSRIVCSQSRRCQTPSSPRFHRDTETDGSHHLSNRIRHRGFDKSPPCRIIRIRFRQSPETVEMIRKQHPGFDNKRMMAPYIHDCRTQCVPCNMQTEPGTPGVSYDRKEVACPERSFVGIRA